jgi:hypothetical protein
VITRATFGAVLTVAVPLVATVLLGAQRPDAYSASRDHAAVQYSSRALDTAVTRLNRDLETGAVSLSFDTTSGYLSSLLRALQIPVESQLLVFSQTSAQAALITQKMPRAIYFNDAAAVGWVRGADRLEVAALDPRQGIIFYALEQRTGSRPRLARNDGCLECHLTWDTLGVPGWTMISTFPMADDKNAYASGVTVDHRTNFDLRWGGWYVTGKSVPARHYGNLPVVRPASEVSRFINPPVLQTVVGTVDVAGYASPFSDIVASMVLSHQTHMANLLTRVGWEFRVAEHDGTIRQKAIVDRLQQAVVELVDYMLFVDEAPLPRAIQGSSGFAERFAAQGPRDGRGRSLRQLDLRQRMMQYPCSYMIYSPAFDALPPPALEAVFARIWKVLSGGITGAPYTKLTPDDRAAIVEILKDTKPNLPLYFQPGIKGSI